MTPLVREWVKSWAIGGGDPTEAHWFDISNAIPGFVLGKQEAEDIIRTMRPPFDKCMIVGNSALNGVEMDIAMAVTGNDPADGIYVQPFLGFHGQRATKMPQLVYFVQNGHIYAGDPEDKKEMEERTKSFILNSVALFYRSLKTNNSAYVALPSTSYTSRRKQAKGKPPIYEWKTVLIEPQKPSNSLGGTHASPRLHERRGHLRKLKDGREVWVRQCWVGDVDRGVVFHDYKVKGVAA